MDPECEKAERVAALEFGVQDAVEKGLPVDKAERLRDILGRHVDACRRALRDDPPGRVELMTVQLKPGVYAVKAKPGVYCPAKATWLSAYLTTLLAMGFVYRNLQAVWASSAILLPIRDSYRLVSDHQPVNAQVEKSPGIMPNQEADMVDMKDAKCFGKPDMLQGYWQMPLAAEAQELFTIATPQGLFTPIRVPQSVLNATSFFQSEAVYGERLGEVVHFDCLNVGESDPMGSEGMTEDDGFKCVLVMMDDLSNFAWLELSASCTADLTTKHLLMWCKALKVPKVWVSDTASHFKNYVMVNLKDELKIDHHFSVANTPGWNGTCERMIREVVHTLKAILQEERKDVRDWLVVPAVQWALNTPFRERFKSTTYHVMFGRAPSTSFSISASAIGGDWQVHVLDADGSREKAAEVIEAQEVFHKQIKARAADVRDRHRRAEYRRELLNFKVGDYVLRARVRRWGSTLKLVTTWTGPWRVVATQHAHVYDVQNIVSAEVDTVHVVRLRLYADKELEVTSDLKDVFQHTFAQSDFEMGRDIRYVGSAG